MSVKRLLTQSYWRYARRYDQGIQDNDKLLSIDKMNKLFTMGMHLPTRGHNHKIFKTKLKDHQLKTVLGIRWSTTGTISQL